MIIIRPLIRVLSKIIELPKGSYLDPTTLGSGDPDGTNFLRGDGTWSTPTADGYVPYVGATEDVDLGEWELKAGQIEFDQSPTGTTGTAIMRWNDTTGVTETTLKGGSVLLKNGVDLVARVVNKVTPNTTLTKAAYQAVRVSGAQGQRLAVAYAQANNDNNSADTIGLVAETIATNQEGFIITVGQLEDINTTGSLQGETWADGDVLYLSPTTAGRLTNIKPTGLTGHIVVMGYVEYAHAIHGKIYVKIMNGWELDELHNVYINPATLADNDILQYDSASSLWKNEALSTGITVGTTPVTSGTVGRVFFQGTGDVVQQDSNLFWDNTNKRLGLGATPDTSTRLDIRAQGTASTDVAFRVRNTGNTYNIIASYGNELTIIGRNESTEPRLLINRAGSTKMLLGGTTDLNITFPSTGKGEINSGAQGIDIISSSGEIKTRNSSTYTTLSGNFFGIGRTPSARLDVQAQGALSTDIAFRVRNSADSANILEVRGNTTFDFPTYLGGYQGGLGSEVRMGNAGTFFTQSNVFVVTGSSVATASNGSFIQDTSGQNVLFNSRLIATSQISLNMGRANIHLGGLAGDTHTGHNILGIANGTAPSASFTDRFMMYSADRGGTAGKASAHFRAEDGTINVLGDLSGIGTASPGARLDVRAQGALSTDIAFRVRNSADSLNFFQVNGDGTYFLSSGGSATDNAFSRFSDGRMFMAKSGSNFIELNATTNQNRFFFSSNGAEINVGAKELTIQGTTCAVRFGQNNLQINTGAQAGSGTNAVMIQNGTAPSTSPTDHFWIYSADIVAGNAAPHFRTENGNIIKLYRQSSAGITTVADLVTVLTNLGLLA